MARDCPSFRRLIRRLTAWVCGLLFCSSSVVIAHVDDIDLTHLVSQDAGVCVELHDLRSQIQDIPKAEWFRRVVQLPLIKRWQQGPEFAKLQAELAGLAVLIGQPMDAFVSELFGESVVLAIFPNPKGAPGVLLLSRAAKDDTWDRVLTLWDQLEAHEVETRSAFGRSFQRRRKKWNGETAGPDLFTLKLGKVIVISQREELIREVLTRATADKKKDRPPSLPELRPYRDAQSSLPVSCVVRVFVNPRRWDETISRVAGSNPLWQSLVNKVTWLSAGLELRDGVVAHAVLRHRTDDLPAIWNETTAAATRSSNLAARLPAKALLAGEIRLSPTVFRWLQTLDPSEKSQRDWQTLTKVAHGLLGRDLFEEVLPHFRPSLGGAIVAKSSLAENSAPVDGLLAWEVDQQTESSNEGGQPNLHDALDGALLTGLNLIGLMHNGKNPDQPAILRREVHESGTIRWLDSVPPYRPTYSLGREHLLLATDPDMVRDFLRSSSQADRSLESDSLFSEARARHFGDASHWLLLNARRTREFLTQEQESLSRQVAYWRGVAPPTASASLERVREVLTPFDAIFVAGKVAHGEIRLTVGAITPNLSR